MKLGGALKMSLQGIDYVSARTLSGAGMFSFDNVFPLRAQAVRPRSKYAEWGKGNIAPWNGCAFVQISAV